MKRSLLLFLLGLFLMACSEDVYQVGFIGDLSTRNSQLAVDARNAISLLIDEVNTAGGIHGHKVTLVVKDDEADISIAKTKHMEFKDESVEIVIGHLKSVMAEAINTSQSDTLLFVSPSISTDTMTGLDDFFLRSSPINSRQADILSDYLHYKEIKALTVVYDQSNAEYTQNLVAALKERYEYEGHRIVRYVAYDTLKDDLSDVAEVLVSEPLDHVLFLCQATDSAFFQQTLVQHSVNYKALSVSWSMTKDLIELGGAAVEGTVFVGIYKSEEDSEAYLSFADRFKDRYGYPPSFISVLAYDAANVVLEGMRTSGSDKAIDVKKAILEIGQFQGLDELFTIDHYGDNNRKYMLYILESGHFIPLTEW